MKSLRVSLVLASLLLLSATTLSAQSSRVACKDGSQPKIGHFSCWGHGGLVAAAPKSLARSAEKPAAKAAKKTSVVNKEKKQTAKKQTAKKQTAKKQIAKKQTAKKPHATLAKSHKKTHPKRPATHVEK
jgi:hypothetical protein